MDSRSWDEIAGCYHDEVVSPFLDNDTNPLLVGLANIDANGKKVAEFGCGMFYLGERLSKMFKEVHASDFSKEMVKRASEKNKHLSNVHIEIEDVREINYDEDFDVIISVNSMIMPSFRDNLTALCNIYDALRKEGTFF